MKTSRSAPSVIESDLQNAYILAVPARFPRMRVFRRNIIAAQLTGGHWVRAGIPGQCDLYAMVRRFCPIDCACEHPEPCPYHFALPIEIECKNVCTVTTDKQEKWRAFCEEWGIPYLCLRARADETPDATVTRWLEETAMLLSLYGA